MLILSGLYVTWNKTSAIYIYICVYINVTSGSIAILREIAYSRYDSVEFLLYVAEVPFGLLPILEFDGHVLCQSKAIARYLAHKYSEYFVRLCDHCQHLSDKPASVLSFNASHTKVMGFEQGHRHGFRPGWANILEKIRRVAPKIFLVCPPWFSVWPP